MSGWRHQPVNVALLCARKQNNFCSSQAPLSSRFRFVFTLRQTFAPLESQTSNAWNFLKSLHIDEFDEQKRANGELSRNSPYPTANPSWFSTIVSSTSIRQSVKLSWATRLDSEEEKFHALREIFIISGRPKDQQEEKKKPASAWWGDKILKTFRETFNGARKNTTKAFSTFSPFFREPDVWGGCSLIKS